LRPLVNRIPCLISDNRHGVYGTFVFRRCYAALIGSLSPTFWGNLSVQSSRVKQPRLPGDCFALEHGTDRLS